MLSEKRCELYNTIFVGSIFVAILNYHVNYKSLKNQSKVVYNREIAYYFTWLCLACTLVFKFRESLQNVRESLQNGDQVDAIKGYCIELSLVDFLVFIVGLSRILSLMWEVFKISLDTLTWCFDRPFEKLSEKFDEDVSSKCDKYKIGEVLELEIIEKRYNFAQSILSVAGALTALLVSFGCDYIVDKIYKTS